MIPYINPIAGKYFVFTALFMGLLVPVVFAHNVVSGAYTEGMMIEGEVGFSNGEMAEAGSPVQVLNATGDVLAEISLSEGGVFSYEAKTVAKHIFKANLSAGHVAIIVVSADELVAPIMEPEKVLSGDLDALSAKQAVAKKAQVNGLEKRITDNYVNNLTVDQLQGVVRSAVAQQVKPLQKELRAYKEKVMFRDIAGGLGFIFGLFGVAAWMASRRKEGEKNATIS